MYPIGPSVQFYNIFLREEVSAQLDEYDAIAIIEWDVVVAHESSFHRLHEAAFANSEPFWIKGSTLAGDNSPLVRFDPNGACSLHVSPMIDDVNA